MRIKGALDSLPLCPCGASYREKCVPSGAVVCWDMPSRSAHSGTARLPHVPCIHSHSHSRPHVCVPRAQLDRKSLANGLSRPGSLGVCTGKQAGDGHFLGYWAESTFKQLQIYLVLVPQKAFHVCVVKGSPWDGQRWLLRDGTKEISISLLS